MYNYNYTNELYHFGVKGMKWGHRKSKAERQAARVEKWKTKHIAKVEKRMNKDSIRYYKKRDKAYNKMYDSVSTEGLNSKRSSKAMQKLYESDTRMRYKRSVAEAEISKIKSMSVSDIKTENREVGKGYAASVATFTIAAAARAMGAPIVAYTVPNTRAIRSNSRVNSEARTNLMNKAANEAADSLQRDVKLAYNGVRINTQ